MNSAAAALFVVSAFALLGSPGPGIAALLGLGRLLGFVGTLRFFAGLQIGLAIAAAMSASGLLSILSALPGLAQLLTGAACVYPMARLVATSPVGNAANANACRPRSRWTAAVSTQGLPCIRHAVRLSNDRTDSGSADATLKWVTVAVIIAVDLICHIGVRLGRLALSAEGERKTNVGLGFAIVAVALNSLRGLAA
jgi:hypothetical protein